VIRGLSRRYRQSLHLRILVPILVIGVLFALTGGTLLYSLFKAHAKEEMTRWAVSLADSVNYAAESSHGAAELERFVTALGAERDIDEIVVVAGRPPEVLAATSMAWWRRPLDTIPHSALRTQIRQAIAEGPTARWRHDGAQLIAAVPLRVHRPRMEPARLAAGAVYIALDTREELRDQLGHAVLAGLAVGAFILIIAAYGYGVLRHRVQRPLGAIQQAVASRRQGDTSAYAPVLSDDAVGQLARATNELLDAQAEREALYRQMFLAHPAIKLIVDPATETLYDVNPAAAAFYGYSREAMQGMSLDRINTLGRERIQEEMARAAEEPGFHQHYPHRLASGEVRTVEVHSAPIQVGGRHYLFSIIHDVTEQDRHRRQLEIYAELFQNLPVGIYRNSPGQEGRFLEVNPAMLRIFEADSPKELKAHPVSDLYQHPEDREEFAEDLLARGGIQGRELRARSLRGRPIWIAITAYKHEDEYGTVFFDGVVEDITERKEAEAARDRLLEILESTPDFVSMADADGEITYLSAGARHLLGLPPSETGLGDDLPTATTEPPQAGQFGHPAWAARKVQEKGIPTALQEGSWQGETAILDRDGNEIPVSQVIIAHHSEDGSVARLSTIMRDIRERKTFEQALQRNWQQLQDIANSLPGAVFQMEVGPEGDYRFAYVSEGLRSLLELTAWTDLTDPDRVLDRIHPDDRPSLEESLHRAMAEEAPWDFEARAQTRAGDKWIHGRAVPRAQGGGRFVFNGVLIEITERKQLEQELERQATHDRLTGLLNRQRLEEFLDKEIHRAQRYGSPFSLVMFDVDHFKAVNDTYGHAVGDRTLQRLAREAQDRLRASDCLARWGGEEFTILLPETGIEGAATLAEALRRTVAETAFTEAGGRITISLGVAEYRKDEPRKALLKRLDDALYRAKEEGRNRVERG
jgi:diguanylate cyclase (GGDEF)-like protein/PAS domain S-box-containing protein